jgi:hypothetical protein
MTGSKTQLAVTLYRSMLRVLRQPVSKVEGRLMMPFVWNLEVRDWTTPQGDSIIHHC